MVPRSLRARCGSVTHRYGENLRSRGSLRLRNVWPGERDFRLRKRLSRTAPRKLDPPLRSLYPWNPLLFRRRGLPKESHAFYILRPVRWCLRTALCLDGERGERRIEQRKAGLLREIGAALHREHGVLGFSWGPPAWHPRTAARSRQDGPTSKPAAIAPSVEHTEHLHRLVVLAEVDDIRKSFEHDAPKTAVRDRERARRLERALERRVDLGDELAPEAGAPGFVPAEGLLDVRLRRLEDDEDHFEPRMRAFASDQWLNDAASALSSRRSSSSLCHSGAGVS